MPGPAKPLPSPSRPLPGARLVNFMGHACRETRPPDATPPCLFPRLHCWHGLPSRNTGCFMGRNLIGVAVVGGRHAGGSQLPVAPSQARGDCGVTPSVCLVAPDIRLALKGPPAHRGLPHTCPRLACLLPARRPAQRPAHGPTLGPGAGPAVADGRATADHSLPQPCPGSPFHGTVPAPAATPAPG